MKTVEHYEVIQGQEVIRLDLFHDLQDIVGALNLQGKEYEAFTVFTDGTREPIYNLI